MSTGKLLFEPFQVPDSFGDDFGNISVINGVARWTVYCWQSIPNEPNPVMVGVNHMIMPAHKAKEAIAKLLQAILEAELEGKSILMNESTEGASRLLS
jgi:hypothetical protein